MKNYLLIFLALFLALFSMPIMAQQSQQNTSFSGTVAVSAADLQTICNAATDVLENNQNLTSEQKKILKKAQKAGQWSPKDLAAFETEIKQLNKSNNGTGVTGYPCVDALTNCEDNCAKAGASYYGSNCLAICQIDYTDCLAKARKSQSIMVTPTKIEGVKSK